MQQVVKKLIPVVVGGIVGSSILTCSVATKKKRVTIRDAVVGSPYKILEVNGKPAERVEHGLVVTRVPLVIVEEGLHILSLEEVDTEEKKQFDIEVKVYKGFDYRIAKDENDKPVLVITDD